MLLPSFEKPLSAEVMTYIMNSLMTGQMADQDIARFLKSLATRGETSEEIAVAVQVLRKHAVDLPLKNTADLCDTCGTGGDKQGTINVSTLAALVAAGSGVRIVKHGNRAASSRCGSADILEALGMNLEASPEQVARCVDTVGFGFCFAPRFHPAMKAVAPIRKALGVRTIFNLIGPLANPAPLTYQLVGVSEASLMRPMAEALLRLGIKRGMVVYADDGLDEVTTTGPTRLLELKDKALVEQSVTPEQFGFSRTTVETLRGGDKAQNAEISRRILEGERMPARDIVVLNAACAIYIAGKAASIKEGIEKAASAIDSKAALVVLERTKELTRNA